MAGIWSRFHTTAPLPRRRSSRASPSSEPMASPSGLTWLVSRKRLPCRILRSRSSGAFVAGIEALQKVGNGLAVLGAAVELEMQLRRHPQPQAAGELGAQEAAGVLERGDGALSLLLGAQGREPDHRLVQVGGDVDVDEPQQARMFDARVVDVALHQVGELGAQQVRHPAGAPAHGAASSSCGSQRVRYASAWLSTRSRMCSISFSISASFCVTMAIEISARWWRS